MADNYEIDVTLEEIFGTGISSVEQTVESHEPNGVNEVTVTLTNGQTSVFNVRNGDSSGKPTPVSLVSEMTNPAEIYLYTGSEEGYVKGDIYCYKNGEWSDVGAYGGMLVDDELDADSENAVTNKAITEAINATPQLRIVENGKYVVAVPDRDASTASVYMPTTLSMGLPDSLQTDTKSSLVDAINEVKADTNALIAAVGSPMVASTVSAMTDHTKIYVYTGTESSYTYGHWYYWDGVYWEDGGVYQSDGLNTDKTLSVPNQAADGKAVGDEISALKSAIASKTGLSNEAKVALLNIFQHVAYVDDDGQDYYDALETALNPPTNLSYITAVYTQSGTVYDSDSLNSLKADLVVTAHYDDLTTETVTAYTLSGTLTEGTSTITVTYSGKTTTFDVTVTERTYGWYYPFNNSIESVGTKEFGWTGTANFGEGVNGQAFHKVSGTDPVKTVSPTNKPDLSGDFTFACWFKQPNNDANTYILCNHDAKKGTAHTVKQSLSASGITMHDSNWSYTIASIGAYQDMAGFTFFYASSLLALRGWDNTGNDTGFQIRFTPPASLDRTQWNHYAVTRSGDTIMVFVNGHKIASLTCSYALYFADRVTFGASFTERTSTDTIDSGSSTHEAYYDDMYLNDSTCKWTADFDPETIVY